MRVYDSERNGRTVLLFLSKSRRDRGREIRRNRRDLMNTTEQETVRRGETADTAAEEHEEQSEEN